MLKEYLLETAAAEAAWSGAMPGAEICRFALTGSGAETLALPVRGKPLHFEALFCLGGRLAAEPDGACRITVTAGGVFLLSDVSQLRSLAVSGDLRGILICVDARRARESLQALCTALGLSLDTAVVGRKMRACRGCAALADTPWTAALFEDLARLPAAGSGSYCLFKSVELLYLFCTSDPTDCGEVRPDAYPSHAVAQVRACLEAHLDQRLTIEELCRRFSLSPTSLKTTFRRMYGQPLHRWLIQKRMQRARELMRTSDLPILRIAQDVGYSSVSQFSAAFKQHCGMTPGQYKKMSETGDPRLF